MLFARSIFSFLAQALVAGVYALQSSRTPWLAAARWFPVYSTLIDAGCLVVLWWLTRREGIALPELISFDRSRWRRDLVLGLGLIPVSLVFIFAGISASSRIVFGTLQPPALFQPLPLVPALYAVLVFPAIWGLTEEMTYNGYLAPRLQVLSRSTVVAVAVVSFAWSFQHAFQPLTFDPDFMLYRLLAPLPFSAFACLAYLRIRRLLPFVIAHWLMNAGDVLVTVLLPLFQ
jgi:membrane protease YdiL (CAAX protease family)